MFPYMLAYLLTCLLASLLLLACLLIFLLALLAYLLVCLLALFVYLLGFHCSTSLGGWMGWWAGAGLIKIKTKLSPKLGLAKLELGLNLAKILG